MVSRLMTSRLPGHPDPRKGSISDREFEEREHLIAIDMGITAGSLLHLFAIRNMVVADRAMGRCRIMGGDDVILEEDFARNARNTCIGSGLVFESLQVGAWQFV